MFQTAFFLFCSEQMLRYTLKILSINYSLGWWYNTYVFPVHRDQYIYVPSANSAA